LHKREFKEWKQSRQGEIWLHGTVGTGKSCLTSIVINDLIETFTDERLAFFYCSREYTPIDVFRSLVAQLSTSANGESITADIKAYYESKI
jgi:DNA replication protein DnaC